MKLGYFMAVAMLGIGLLSAPVQAQVAGETYKPPPPPPLTKDHLKCFDVDLRHKSYYTEWVELWTQFGYEKCEVKVDPELLCAAAAKKHSYDDAATYPPPAADAGNYLCHELKKCYEDKYHKTRAEVSDQFGKFKVKLDEAEFLCAPATIKY
jgi:hypothetical protein